MRGYILAFVFVSCTGGNLAAPAAAGPLHDAAMAGDLDGIERALAAGADVNETDPLGSAFYLALFARQAAAARRLLEAGADPTRGGVAGPPLTLAVQTGDAALVEEMLAAGSDPNAGGFGAPLLVAAQAGAAEIVRLLLESGADTRAADKNGLTALHLAAGSGSTGAIGHLLSYGAESGALTLIGKPPIHYAAAGGHAGAAEALRAAGWAPDPVEPIARYMAAADPDRGKAAYDADCLHCHPIARDRYYIGPEMAEVFEKPIGWLEDFPYSPALATTEGVWDEETLSRYMAQPTQAIPGTTMDTAVIAAPSRRADIIAYLQALREQN